MNKRGQNSPTLFFSENRKGQVTIFIIIGVIIISIILFFLLKVGIIPDIGEEKNPNAFLESCLEDKIKESVKLISLQGGFVDNPLHKSFKLESEKSPVKISYLCYNQNDAFLCVAQEPLLIPHIKNEIYNSISKDVENCFDKLKMSIENEGYLIDMSYIGFKVDLTENKIEIPMEAEVTLTKNEESKKYEDFKIIIPSKLYDLAFMAQEIVNKEATTGQFNHYDIFSYPKFDIKKYRTTDSSIIYFIKYENSDEEFRFAVRGAVVPPGFGFEFK